MTNDPERKCERCDSAIDDETYEQESVNVLPDVMFVGKGDYQLSEDLPGDFELNWCRVDCFVEWVVTRHEQGATS